VSDQFQHVMVLASIIIGLGITNALLGISAAIDSISAENRTIRFSWAAAFWLAGVFLWMVLFWWWEFRLLTILKNWSMGNYLLVIFYAVLLFLLVALLVPRKWDEVDDLNVYFLSKRHWFYPLLLLTNGVDVIDSYMKGGWTYIDAAGVVSWSNWIAYIPACIVGFRSNNARTHTIMAIIFFVWTVVQGFDVYPLLGR
jgi:hypothetical protein